MSYKFLYGLNYGTGARDINVAGWLQGFSGISGAGLGAILNQTLFTQIIDHTLNYTGNITKSLSIDALAGFEYYKRDVLVAVLVSKWF